LQRLQQNRLFSRPLMRCLRQAFSHAGAQAFSQAGAHAFSQAGAQAFSQAGAHAGAGQAFSQAAGAAHAFSQQAGFAHSASLQRILLRIGRHFAHLPQPQACSQAGAGQAFSQQAGFAQAGSGQHALAGAQASVLQHLLHSNTSFSPQNRSRTGVQHRLPHGFSQPAAFSQQAGSGAQALAGWQHSTLHGSQAPQPPHFSPCSLPRSSPLNPWAQRATLRRSAPNINLLFIEQSLLYNEPVVLGFPWRDRKPEFRLVHHPMA
jgi:hypothetical protein